MPSDCYACRLIEGAEPLPGERICATACWVVEPWTRRADGHVSGGQRATTQRGRGVLSPGKNASGAGPTGRNHHLTHALRGALRALRDGVIKCQVWASRKGRRPSSV